MMTILIKEKTKKEQLRVVFKTILDRFVTSTHDTWGNIDVCDNDINDTIDELLIEVSIRTNLR